MAENDRIADNNDDNSNSSPPVVQEAKPTRRNRIPRRELFKRQIRRLRNEQGLTINEIAEQLGIGERSVRRYLLEIYSHEREILEAPTAAELSLEVAQFKEDTMLQIRDVKAIANDPEVEAADRMAAHDWLINTRWALLKLNYQSLSEIAKHLQLYDSVRFIQKRREEEKQAMMREMEQKALPNIAKDLQ